jgi:TetR/AcrR family transcriptional regulator, transcriptional repressor for nem operon
MSRKTLGYVSEMTDSQGAPARKRERLVAGASKLLHHNGVAATSLAEIAQAADVPLGNVYYYFKSKDELIRAVLAEHIEEVDTMLNTLDAIPAPTDRLKALVRRWDHMREVVARYGCPFGTLACELDRRSDGLDVEAAGPIRRILDWSAAQIQHLSSADPHELAITLFAAVQGGALLANALRDPTIMSGQVQRLERWIDTLAAQGPHATVPPAN